MSLGDNSSITLFDECYAAFLLQGHYVLNLIAMHQSQSAALSWLLRTTQQKCGPHRASGMPMGELPELRDMGQASVIP